MKFDEETTLFIAAILLVAGTVSIYLIYFGDRVVMPYSEIGILGRNMIIGDYPTEPAVGEGIDLNIYLGNYEGKLMYYSVLVKLSDATGSPGNELLDAPVIETLGAIVSSGENRTIQFQTRLFDEYPNHKLVFELHAYNEETNRFEYTGRWGHLWLNTEPETP